MKTKLATGILIFASIALVSGAVILAAAAPGSQSDPFITLDYLNNKFKPEILAMAEVAGQEFARDFEKRIDDLEAFVEANQGSAAPAPAAADRFSVVTLGRGQTLTCSVGVEIMLRIGSANGFGSEPALVNYTSGETLSNGTALVQNNMYLVTIEGNGIIAAENQVRVLVRGAYTIT